LGMRRVPRPLRPTRVAPHSGTECFVECGKHRMNLELDDAEEIDHQADEANATVNLVLYDEIRNKSDNPSTHFTI
jgi:hypothetical protein